MIEKCPSGPPYALTKPEVMFLFMDAKSAVLKLSDTKITFSFGSAILFFLFPLRLFNNLLQTSWTSSNLSLK